MTDERAQVHELHGMEECSRRGEERFEGRLGEPRDCELLAEEPEDCSCRFCFCMNETDHGEVCPMCLAGAHQG